MKLTDEVLKQLKGLVKQAMVINAQDVEDLIYRLECAEAFIESHVADPDITGEMATKYQAWKQSAGRE